jgi:hypothetical protein
MPRVANFATPAAVIHNVCRKARDHAKFRFGIFEIGIFQSLSREFMKNRVYAGALIASAILSACGGGGSSTTSPSTTPAASATKAEGLYSGTTTTGYVFNALVLENDEIWALYGVPNNGALSVYGVNWAQGTSSNGTYSASNAKDYYYTGAVTTGTLNASYVASSSFNGTAVANGVSTGFTSAPPTVTNYLYNTAATLSTISGSWSGSTLFTGETGTVTIASNGNISASFNGSYIGTCTGTGTAHLTCPPINRTSYFSKKSINPENDGHENKQIQRRANHLLSAAGRSGHADQGDRAQTRLQ